jgi:hypothetical protein
LLKTVPFVIIYLVLACIHNWFGFFNFSPLIISSNVPGFSSYLSIQNLYSGTYNFISKIAPIASHINVNLFRELGQGFYDQQIFDLIQFCFPLDLEKSTFIPNSAVPNHGSAIKFPTEVDNYFSEEISLGSIFGPFSVPPLSGLMSTLMTAPKDGDRRRIIVDLSFPSPQQYSVNLSVSKFSYVGSSTSTSAFRSDTETVP